MQTFELEPALWSDYFEMVTREHAGSAALVRAGSCAIADRPGGAVARRLRAICFDVRRCAIEIDVGGLDRAASAIHYYVERPRRIVAKDGGDSRGILILGREDLCTVVWLERLPAIRRPTAPTRRCPCPL